MKRAMLTLMALTISVILVAAVTAAEEKGPASSTTGPAAPKVEKFSGVVERVDAAKKVFSVKSGKEEMTFSWVDKTIIVEGKKEITLADLKKGLNVSVIYIKDGGKSIAARIGVRTSMPMGTKEKTPSTTEKK
jgi:Cu/Ag efflux protein CusF